MEEERCYAVLKDGCFIHEGSQGPYLNMPLTLTEAKLVIGHHPGSQIVVIQPYPGLFDLIGPSGRLLKYGEWVSNGFVLTRNTRIEWEDDPRVENLVKLITPRENREKVKRICTCPPNEFTLDASMFVFVPEQLEPPYQGQIKSLICISKRLIDQVVDDLEAVNFFVVRSQVGNYLLPVLVIQIEGQVTGACMSLHISVHKQEYLVNLIDQSLSRKDW